MWDGSGFTRSMAALVQQMSSGHRFMRCLPCFHQAMRYGIGATSPSPAWDSQATLGFAWGWWHVHILYLHKQLSLGNFESQPFPAWGKTVSRRKRLNTCDPNGRSLSSLAARSIALLCEATLAQALRESELGLPVMIRAQPCRRQQEDDLSVCRDWKLSNHWTLTVS